MKYILSSLLLLALAVPAHAGKVDKITAAVKSKCNKDLAKTVARKAVKAVFVACSPGSPVNVDGCDIDCLKGNDGVTVGGN